MALLWSLPGRERTGDEGHENHMRAINTIRGAGVLPSVVKAS